jgi:acetylornithine/N-succinyldiaminopimelate aminotransferase
MAEGASPTVSNDHIMGVYNRAPLSFERGRGARLYTEDGV